MCLLGSSLTGTFDAACTGGSNPTFLVVEDGAATEARLFPDTLAGQQVANNEAFRIAVRAYRGEARSAWVPIEQGTVTPEPFIQNPPTNVSVSAPTADGFTVEWDAPEREVLQYEVCVLSATKTGALLDLCVAPHVALTAAASLTVARTDTLFPDITQGAAHRVAVRVFDGAGGRSLLHGELTGGYTLPYHFPSVNDVAIRAQR